MPPTPPKIGPYARRGWEVSRKIKAPKRDPGLAFRLSVPPRPCWLCRSAAQEVGFYCRACHEHQERCRETCKRVNRGRRVQRLAPIEERGRGLSN